MSHGWRGLVCRSACKPHFHLPIFTFLDTQRALFFLLLTVLQQVVSGKLCLQNTLTKLGYSFVEFLLWRKASKIERLKGKNIIIKQPSYLAYFGTVIGSYCINNVDGCKNFPTMFGKENSWLCSGRFFPITLHKDTDAWCFLNFVLCERSGGEFQEVFLISQG